ncbi:MAG: DUF2007 domain-containing protein [Proteobacteria bacterium]|nr:DUF2007 domain-containing protein [Pseudomonadota bacterium]
MRSLTIIASYRDLPLAELAKSKLESEGIPCFLLNKNIIALNWLYSNALGGVELQVRTEDVENALKILKDDHSSDLLDIENEFPEPEQGDLCTNCGSSNIRLIKVSRKYGALSLLLSFPLILFGKKYQCKDCGHKMN